MSIRVDESLAVHRLLVAETQQQLQTKSCMYMFSRYFKNTLLFTFSLHIHSPQGFGFSDLFACQEELLKTGACDPGVALFLERASCSQESLSLIS